MRIRRPRPQRRPQVRLGFRIIRIGARSCATPVALRA